MISLKPYKILPVGTETIVTQAIGADPAFALLDGPGATGPVAHDADDPDLIVMHTTLATAPHDGGALLAAVPGAQLLLLMPERELARFRAGLPFMPQLGRPLTASQGIEAEALATMLREAAASASSRRALGTVMARINDQLGRKPLPDAEEPPVSPRLSDRYFATLLASSPDAFFAVDGAGHFLALNDAASALFAVGPLLEGIALTDAIHDDGRPALAGLLRDAHQHEGRQALELRLATHDGERWIEISLARIPDDRVTPGFSGTAREITDRKALESQLRQLNETLEARVDQRTQALRDSMDFTRLVLSAVGGVGVWTFDAQTDCFTCDANIAKLYDIDPEEAAAGILRERFLANVHDDDRAALTTTMSGGLVRPGDLELEYRLVHRDGSVHWVLSRGHTYFDEEGRAVRRTGVGVDMTRQRELEGQLRQAQKMEAVGQLTGGIAHDFNNLLQGITGSLEIVQRRIARGQTGDIDRFLSGATTSAHRAAALTHRLLAFSRRQPLDPRPVQANTLILSMEDLLRRTLGENVALHFALATDLWTARCDANQLENAILNLAINARDAMPDGGTLAIASSNRDLDAQQVAKLGQVKAGPYVCLEVADTGVGMNADTLAKAFEPFFTTKPIGQGTGLGLSMIYGFARQSEGHVQIASEPGKGTSFQLYLPRHGGADKDEGAQSDKIAHEQEPTGEVVLVVEDEAIVRALILEELAELGYVGIEAVDGPQALEALQSNRRIDLLITDIGLPGINGRQVAEAGRLLRPDLKILFMTGYAENAALAAGFLESGMAMVTKPFAMSTLAGKIRSMVEDIPS